MSAGTSYIFLHLFSSSEFFVLKSAGRMPALHLTIQRLPLTASVIRRISHPMATLSRSVPAPTQQGVTVSGGHGSSGPCSAMIFRSTGAMQLIGLSTQNVTVYPWEQLHGLAR